MRMLGSPATATAGSGVRPSRTNARTYRPELDGIRALAVLTVLIGHTHLLGFSEAGTVGVTMFFVLSGYLITGILLDRPSLRDFYRRRARRLLPALLACVVVSGGVMAAAGLAGRYIPQAALALGYVANIAYARGFDLGYLTHTWSLSVEGQFYVVWPLLILLAPRRLVPLAIIGIAATVLLRLVLAPEGAASYGTDFRLDALLWGCLLALRPIGVRRGVGRLALLALALLLLSNPEPMRIGLSAIAIATVVLIADPPAALAHPLLVRIGLISYGLYLWHMLPALLLDPLTIQGDPAAIIAVFAASFALALISAHWIERRWTAPREALPAGPSTIEPVLVVEPAVA